GVDVSAGAGGESRGLRPVTNPYRRRSVIKMVLRNSAAAGLFDIAFRRRLVTGGAPHDLSPGKEARSMNLCARIALIFFLATIPVMGLAGEKKGKQAPKQPDPVDLSQPLTLDRAIKIALDNQQTLGIAQAQLVGARARQTTARAQYFPTIAPTFEYSNQLTTIGGNTGNFDTKVGQIGLRQMVFD